MSIPGELERVEHLEPHMEEEEEEEEEPEEEEG